jgi:hypothetical protein
LIPWSMYPRTSPDVVAAMGVFFECRHRTMRRRTQSAAQVNLMMCFP